MRIHCEIIQLDYNPITDVLFVEWPDIHTYNFNEISAALGEIIVNIRYFGVKRLLIDSRKTVMGISNEQYDKMTARFIKDLIESGLEKVARIESADSARESRLQDLIKSYKTSLAFQNFANKEEALKWLEKGVYRF